MRILIVEDEVLAAQNLSGILSSVGSVEIIAILESIRETVAWFTLNDPPDILFLDIHLADGSAFDVFERIRIDCPVIFTTAYDEYAIKAFRVNSIDYLLKPIDEGSVRRALEKYKLYKGNSGTLGEDIQKLVNSFRKKISYRASFLVPVRGDKLQPIDVDDIAFFFIDFGAVKAVMLDGKSYNMEYTLDELTEMVNPDIFFRANRQFIISRKSIKDIDMWFNGRLSVNLKVSVPEKILVSKARVPEFRNWFSGAFRASDF